MRSSASRVSAASHVPAGIWQTTADHRFSVYAQVPGNCPAAASTPAASSSSAPRAVRKSRTWPLVPVMAFMRVASSVDWPISQF